MTTSSSSHSFVNPLLLDADRVSPAVSLDLVVGFDDEGWALRRTFIVGQVVVTVSGNLYKVIGFNLDGELFLMPFGLGHDPMVRFITALPVGLQEADEPLCGDMDEAV